MGNPGELASCQGESEEAKEWKMKFSWASQKEEPAKELETGVCRLREASRGHAQGLEV